MGYARTILPDAPILLLDVAGFTSEYTSRDHRRTVLRALQEILTDQARFFEPYADVWAKWIRHGTGDGYYIILETQPPQVVVEYALRIRAALAEHNAASDLPFRLRVVLAYGDVEWVDDQILSDAFATAERFMSSAEFKAHAEGLPDALALLVTDLFREGLRGDLRRRVLFPGVGNLEWSAVQVVDKHGCQHRGHVLGPRGWGMGAPSARRLYVTILVGHSLHEPIPRALEMAKVAANVLEISGLGVSLRVDIATATSLRRELALSPDLLIFYGHGTEDGRLVFADGLYTATQVQEGCVEPWTRLPCILVFACHGERFARMLPCPWVAYREPILQDAPRGFLEMLVAQLGTRSFSQAIENARASCGERMESTFSEVMAVSDRGLPELPTARGEFELARASPALARTFHVDFGVARDGDHLYPDHDPFVGRQADIDHLLKLPVRGGDGGAARVIWVHGDAGMGKSALLRQLCIQVRDCTFWDREEPVHLLHRHCYKFTRGTEVEAALCETARLSTGCRGGLTPSKPCVKRSSW